MPAADQAAGVAVAAPAVPPPHIPIHQHEVSGMSTPTKTQIARRIAELQPTRATMSAAMAAYFQAHASKIVEIDAVREANRNARAEGRAGAPMPAPLPPMGVAATVGLGKSHAVKQIADAARAADLPVVILVPNHKLAQEHAERLAHLGAVVYQGRRDPAAGKPNGPPVDPGAHACYRLVQVSKAGDQNHRPALGLCSKCPNGQAAVLQYVTRDELRRQRAEQFFKTNGIDPAAVPPCQFLYKGLPDQLAAPILVAPVQAFSEAMAAWRETDPETGFILREAQRLTIVDEHIGLSAEVEIGAGDIKVWRNRVDGLVERLDRQIEFLRGKDALNEAEQEELEQARAMRALTPEIDATFRDLASKIAGDIPLGEDAQHVINLQKKVAKVGASVAGTASWEKVSYLRDEDDFFIPLRALATLARNLAAGSARQEKGVLFAYETSPVIEWARDKGSVMFLDATMSQSMRRLIESRGGYIHDATDSQNMRVTRVMGRLYSRGGVKKTDYPMKAKARMEEIRDLIAPGMDKPAAIITHKAYLKYSQEAHQSDDAADVAAMDFEEGTGVPIGWFGKHDRGLDSWGGRHLALVGMPLLSEESIAGAYACTRAAMIDCGIPMPEWDRVVDKDKPDADGPPMPVMPEVRAWLLDEYAQGLAQAIGRNRAVNHPRGCKPLQVHLWGGLQTPEMDAALQRYGVMVHDRMRNPHSAPGPKVDAGAVDAAVEMVLAAGGRVSERSVRGALVGLSRSASTEAIRARIRELRASGAIPAATRVRRDDASDPGKADGATESVCAASAHIHVEALESDSPKIDAAEASARTEPQKQGQEKITHPTSVTAPNSYKDTKSGNSAQCCDKPNHQKQGQEKILFAPAFDFDSGATAPGLLQLPPTDEIADEIADMLAEIAAEIEAELAAQDDDDPDDDPDDPGPGGRRAGRDQPSADPPPNPAGAAFAALSHIQTTTRSTEISP
ncbi:MAG TPA: hypothetical protein PKE37_07275 [Thiomonas arsenitoxydans]|uniref:hypothetical protein n=1 Tax=Thiomonas TaxID=32012 RepID=UPI00257B3319|nr:MULTISPECIES: hypothetical protein [Thiomonas]HML81550.1 hypothetical protein [Thiomonas arsenitoxydans]